MKRTILALIMTCCSFVLKAQVNTFSTTFNIFNGDEALCVIQNSAGNYVVCGSVYPGGSTLDPFVAEISTSGSILQAWTITTSTTTEIFRSIVQTSDGGYFLTGAFGASPSDYTALVMKLDASFGIEFYKQFGVTGINDNANRAFEISPGHYGFTGSIGLGGSVKPSLVILDQSGNIIQQSYLGTNQFASPDYRGRYFGNGEVAMGHLTNAFTILDTTGAVVKSFGSGLGIFSVDVQRLSNGNYACLSLDNYGAPTGESTSLLIADSTCTNTLQLRKYSIGGLSLQPSEFIENANGDLLIVGRTESMSSGNQTPVLVKTSSNGALNWAKSYLPAGAPSAKFNSIAATSDGGYIMCGHSGPFNAQKMLLVKVDSTGDISNCSVTGLSLTSAFATTNLSSTHPVYSGTVTGVNATATLYQDTVSQQVLCLNVGLGAETSGPEVVVYPSPAGQQLNIQGLETQRIQIEIYDRNGALVLKSNRMASALMDVQLQSLSDGLYLLILRSDSGELILNKRFVKAQ